MSKEKNVYIGNYIEITGNITREEIVKKVINTFIDFESPKRGREAKFRYPVENIGNENYLYIIRPGGLQKYNMDFKVEVLEEFNFSKGRHGDIEEDFVNKKNESPEDFKLILKVLTDFYECSESDIDTILEEYPTLGNAFRTGAKLNIILKCVKWMFIMEDIVYWNYDGRKMLYTKLISL